jgi:hypothetical protein
VLTELERVADYLILVSRGSVQVAGQAGVAECRARTSTMAG